MINLKFLTLLFAGVFCSQFTLQSKVLYLENKVDSSASISVRVPQGKSITLFYLNKHHTPSALTFSNNSDHDSLFIKKVNLKGSCEFAFRSFAAGKLYEHTFILNRDDSVSFNINNALDLEENDGPKSMTFIDNWFEIYSDWKISKSYKNFTPNDYREYYLKVDKVNRKNIKRLDSLFTINLISTQKMHVWKIFLEIDHALRLLSPISYNFPYNPILDAYLSPRLDSLINVLPQWIDIKSSKINTLLL